METSKILSRAEAWKRKTHRLSLDLRVRSLPEARRFIREQSAVLWNTRAELPNLVDAIIGRIANGKERTQGKPVESCLLWREQLLRDPEFLECHFFRKQSTVLHQDVWPYATVFAKLNRKRATEDRLVSKEAKKILTYLNNEGPARTDHLCRALKLNSVAEKRSFQRAGQELQDLLILLAKEGQDTETRKKVEVLDFWENCVPKTQVNRAEYISVKDAEMKLLSTALHSSVLTLEKNIPRWFEWCHQNCSEALEKLIERKEFLRVKQGKTSWIVSRLVLACKNGK